MPLSEAAIAILRACPASRAGGHVFTTDGDGPVNGFSRMKKRIDTLMEEIAGTDVPDWTLHDIRRTVAAGMQRIGVKMEVTEKY